MLVKGFSKENDRLMIENQSIKHALVDHNKSQAAGKGFIKENLSSSKADDNLREAVSRLQEELVKKDEYYRKRESENKERLAKADFIEKKQAERDQ